LTILKDIAYSTSEADMVINQILQTPTPSLVQTYVTEFEREPESVASDDAIALSVKTFPHNRAIEEVLLKVAAVNQLYNAQMFTTAIYPVAKLICSLDIESKLNERSLDVVTRIAYDEIGQRKRYVFATKYCHFHRPDAYPIFDDMAATLICSYQAKDGFANPTFTKDDLKQYPTYKDIIEKFRSHYGLTGVSFRHMDKFLWRYKGG
jgi:hypothetical protein